jgi:hypothetical protein
MEDGAGLLALAAVTAGFDVVRREPISQALAGKAQADLFDEIGMGQVDIARLTQLFCEAIDQVGRIERVIDGFTDAGYGY